MDSLVESSVFTVMSSSGGEDDDRCGGDLCPLLAALSRALHGDGSEQATDQAEVHPAGVSVRHVAGHELHRVQPRYLLLPQQGGEYLIRVKCVNVQIPLEHNSLATMPH